MRTNKKTKNTKLYDENGHWVEEKTRIKGAIRRVFRLSPQMREVLSKNRIEVVVYKKDGTPAKKPGVRFRCNMCQQLFNSNNIQVDHIETVIPLDRTEHNMSYDEIVRRIFCDISNLQILCSTPKKKNNGVESCHQKKTNREVYIRKRCREGQAFELTNELFNKFNLEYDQYLAEKEQKRLEKEERKRKKALKLKK